MIKVGVIGPTDIAVLGRILGKEVGALEDEARIVGKVLADLNCELWVNSDGGMLAVVAKAYKTSKGNKLVVLTPKEGEPWPKTHTKPYVDYADEIREEKDWFYSNYNVVKLPNLCVCVGLSCGTFSELAYIKWDHQFKCGNLEKLIGITSLLRDGRFPEELEEMAKDKISYVNVLDLKHLIEEFQRKKIENQMIYERIGQKHRGGF